MLLKKILVIFFFISVKIYSQSLTDLEESYKIDSLIKKDQWELVHHKLSNEDINFKRISKYNIKYDLLIKIDSASSLYRKGKFSEAEKSAISFLNLLQKNKNKIAFSYYEALRHIAITRLFYIEKRKGNIAQGLKFLNNLSIGMSPVYKKKQLIFFAVAYIELRDYKKGIDLLNIHLNNIRNDSNNVLYTKFLKAKETAAAYNTKSDAFINWYKDMGAIKFLDSAQKNYEKAYLLMKNSENFSAYSQSLHKSRKAQIALLRKEYDLSLSLFNECEKDSVLMEKSFSREMVWLAKAEIYTHLKKSDSAFKYLEKLTADIQKSKCSHENKLKVYYLLSINYERTGNIEKAYKYSKLSLSEIKKENVQKNAGNFFLGVYEKEEIKNKSEEMLQKNNTNLLLMFASLLLISTIFYKIYYQKRKNKEEIINIRKIESNIPGIQPITDQKVTISTSIEDETVAYILSKLDSLEFKKRFLSNSFKLANIAKQLNTNTTYLSQIINQYKGVSFSEYVNTLRINYIITELDKNPLIRKYNIEVISKEIGYKSCTTFINAFKKRTQMTPSEYIKNLEKM